MDVLKSFTVTVLPVVVRIAGILLGIIRPHLHRLDAIDTKVGPTRCSSTHDDKPKCDCEEDGFDTMYTLGLSHLAGTGSGFGGSGGSGGSGGLEGSSPSSSSSV